MQAFYVQKSPSQRNSNERWHDASNDAYKKLQNLLMTQIWDSHRKWDSDYLSYSMQLSWSPGLSLSGSPPGPLLWRVAFKVQMCLDGCMCDSARMSDNWRNKSQDEIFSVQVINIFQLLWSGIWPRCIHTWWSMFQHIHINLPPLQCISNQQFCRNDHWVKSARKPNKKSLMSFKSVYLLYTKNNNLQQ